MRQPGCWGGVEGDSIGLRGRKRQLSMKKKKRKKNQAAVKESGVTLRCCSHIHSNSSMRCFVLPCRICRRVLYLSRPAFTFSACSTSFWVFLVSSLASANSELNVYEKRREDNRLRRAKEQEEKTRPKK